MDIMDLLPGPAKPISIAIPGHVLRGNLVIPRVAEGIVVFVHAAGRESLGSRSVEQRLHAERLATLRVDLLTSDEALGDPTKNQLRFDIKLLTQRLQAVNAWLQRTDETAGLHVGLFAGGTTAAVAIKVAARHPGWVKALVLHVARADLAANDLPRVQAPTLLVVGENHHEVWRINHEALAELNCTKALEVAPLTTRPFEEPSAMERLAWLTGEWFAQHLTAREPAGST